MNPSFTFLLNFSLKKIAEKIGNIRVPLIWLDYKFSRCISFFSLSHCNIGCHNDLNSFPWEKKIRCRESKMTQKGKSWTKNHTIYNFLGDTDLLFWQYVKFLSSSFNIKTKFYYSEMLFLIVDLYCSTCSFVTSDNRGTYNNSFPANQEALACIKYWCWG